MAWIILILAVFVLGFAIWFLKMGIPVMENEGTFKIALFLFFAVYIGVAVAVYYYRPGIDLPSSVVATQTNTPAVTSDDSGAFVLGN